MATLINIESQMFRMRPLSRACPYCAANPQPLDEEIAVPICCMRAQREAIFGKANAQEGD